MFHLLCVLLVFSYVVSPVECVALCAVPVH